MFAWSVVSRTAIGYADSYRLPSWQQKNKASFSTKGNRNPSQKISSITSKTMFKFLTFFHLLLLLQHSHQSNPKREPSIAVHTELINHGFPIGLLPSSIRGYTLNQTSGEFSVDLGHACRITLPPDNYLATYSKRVSGKIVKGSIAELDGIRVRALFKWWSITGIRSTGDDLVFEVGMVTAKYPSKNFNESPDCEGKHYAS